MAQIVLTLWPPSSSGKICGHEGQSDSSFCGYNSKTYYVLYPGLPDKGNWRFVELRGKPINASCVRVSVCPVISRSDTIFVVFNLHRSNVNRTERPWAMLILTDMSL